MARGNKTSSIPRSPSRVRQAGKKGAAKSARAKLAAVSDLTRPTPRSERIVPKFLGRAALLVGFLVVVFSFGNSFLVLPLTSWFGQRTEIDSRQAELDTIKNATDELQTEVDRLKTPEGVQDAAREELGFVVAGEARQQIVGDSAAPIDLPAGWPYDLVTQIISVKVNEAAAKAAEEAAKNAPEVPVSLATSISTP
ncbi:MAG: septum formation initiator family protein [Actinomycetes bacterium]